MGRAAADKARGYVSLAWSEEAEARRGAAQGQLADLRRQYSDV